MDRRDRMQEIPMESSVESGLGSLQIYTLAKEDSEATSTATTTAASNTPRNANDYFYEAWDKFYKPSPSDRPKVSLDMDIEGKPSNPPQLNGDGVVSKINAQTSFEQAAGNCKAKVNAIVKECKRLNIKYSDRNFDFEDGFTALEYLGAANMPTSILQFSGIGDVKRVDDIFDEPKFMEDGASGNNIRQGQTGSCWFLAALTALGGTEELDQSKRLLSKLCVARDEKVGVYGFVFYRDGEWISEVVDDRLPLRTRENLNMSLATYRKDQVYMNKKCDVITLQKLPKEIDESLGKGSDALYFSSCKDSEETWLSLMEKAYAKVHGNYQSIDSGYPGEGIEDLTGGVNTYIDTGDILDKDRLWNELLEVNKSFLFGCSSRVGSSEDPKDDDKDGIVTNHAYTVMEAREIETEVKGKTQKVRLLKMRNPWGYLEWTGSWADGSKEWTPETMTTLNHRFGDDGIFWIPFKDFLKYFRAIDRTRLFGPEWTVSSQWTTVNVPWDERYLDTKFTIQINKAGPVVIVLCQPDDRYFKGLTGRYTHYLHYRLYKDGEETYLVRSMSISGSKRSCSAELDLEPGNYSIHIKIETERDDAAKTTEEVIKKWRLSHTNMVLALGKRFDAAHSKGLLREMEKLSAERVKREQKKETRDKDIKQQKARRVRKQEERRREKAKKKRIADELKRKKAEKKASKKPSKDAAATEETKTTPTTVAVDESRRSSSAGILTPATTPTQSAATSQKDGAEDGDPATVQAEKKDTTEQSHVTESTSSTADETKKNETQATETKQDDSSSETTATETERDANTNATPPSPTTVHIVDKPAEPVPNTEIKKASSKDEKEQETSSDSEAKQADATGGSDTKVEEATQESTPEPTPEQNTDTTSAPQEKTNSSPNVPAPPPPPTHEATKGAAIDNSTDDDDNDEVSSVKDEDFDWDSEIDGPVEKEEAAKDETDDMYANDPWNAICVVGLRVYSTDPETKIGVVGSTVAADA